MCVFTDVEDVKFVINFDFPNSSENYIHRIGRTGRNKQSGTSYAFFTQQNARHAKELIDVLQEARQVVNPKLSEMARKTFGKDSKYKAKNNTHMYNEAPTNNGYSARTYNNVAPTANNYNNYGNSNFGSNMTNGTVATANTARPIGLLGYETTEKNQYSVPPPSFQQQQQQQQPQYQQSHYQQPQNQHQSYQYQGYY